MIDDKLEIIIPTFNRKKYLEQTLNQLLAEESPIKNYPITILNNASTDGSSELIEEYCRKFPNLKHVCNKKNIGGAANVTRAYEIAQAEYVWVLCDDDKYDFSNWQEVEQAINLDEKWLCVSRYAVPESQKHDLSCLLLQLTFVPANIFKTEIITETVLRNMYDSQYTLFPQLMPLIGYINEGGKIYTLSKAIVHNGYTQDRTDVSYTRGYDNNLLTPRAKSMSWLVGYCICLALLKNKPLREKAIDVAIQYKDICGSYSKFCIFLEQYASEEKIINLLDIYLVIGTLGKKLVLKTIIKTIYKTIKTKIRNKWKQSKYTKIYEKQKQGKSRKIILFWGIISFRYHKNPKRQIGAK